MLWVTTAAGLLSVDWGGGGVSLRSSSFSAIRPWSHVTQTIPIWFLRKPCADTCLSEPSVTGFCAASAKSVESDFTGCYLIYVTQNSTKAKKKQKPQLFFVSDDKACCVCGFRVVDADSSATTAPSKPPVKAGPSCTRAAWPTITKACQPPPVSGTSQFPSWTPELPKMAHIGSWSRPNTRGDTDLVPRRHSCSSFPLSGQQQFLDSHFFSCLF